MAEGTVIALLTYDLLLGTPAYCPLATALTGLTTV